MENWKILCKNRSDSLDRLIVRTFKHSPPLLKLYGKHIFINIVERLGIEIFLYFQKKLLIFIFSSIYNFVFYKDIFLEYSRQKSSVHLAWYQLTKQPYNFVFRRLTTQEPLPHGNSSELIPTPFFCLACSMLSPPTDETDHFSKIFSTINRSQRHCYLSIPL